MCASREAKIWEVFVNVDATPQEAVDALLRYEGVAVSLADAEKCLAEAAQRNSLKLVMGRNIGSNFLHRIGCRA